MLKIGVIGLGNAGGQVARLAFESARIPAIAINSSETDLETVKSIPCILIGDGHGSGKVRAESKRFIKNAGEKFLNHPQLNEFLKDKEFIFIVGGTGGGFGSGSIPLFTALLEDKIKKTPIEGDFLGPKLISTCIMPTVKEGLPAQDNTIQFFKELLKLRPNMTYMVYDNNKFNNLAPNKLLEEVNKDIVDDFLILRGDFQLNTQFDSIDKKESTILMTTPGRLGVLKAYDIKEKDLDNTSIEDILLANMANMAIADLDRNRAMKSRGVISNLSVKLNEKFDFNMPKLTEVLGEPIEPFQHVYVNEDKDQPNNVLVILGGMTAPNDRLQKVFERAEEIVQKQKELDAESNIFDEIDDSSISDLRLSSTQKGNDTSDTKDIFSMFDV